VKLTMILLTAAISLLSGSGCERKLPPPSPERAKMLVKKVKCGRCRKDYKIGECKRINQVLFRCPVCNRIINVTESKAGR
jgi:hypothetical protein